MYRLRYKYSCWWVAILDFWLPLASHNIVTSFVEFLARENMGVACWNFLPMFHRSRDTLGVIYPPPRWPYWIVKFFGPGRVNIHFLPRSIKGISGCFPTALGRQSTVSNILGPLVYSWWRFHFEKIPFYLGTIKAAVYPRESCESHKECFGGVMTLYLHQPARIREETLESRILFNSIVESIVYNVLSQLRWRSPVATGFNLQL